VPIFATTGYDAEGTASPDAFSTVGDDGASSTQLQAGWELVWPDGSSFSCCDCIPGEYGMAVTTQAATKTIGVWFVGVSRVVLSFVILLRIRSLLARVLATQTPIRTYSHASVNVSTLECHC
jgi:hypothetical protein